MWHFIFYIIFLLSPVFFLFFFRSSIFRVCSLEQAIIIYRNYRCLCLYIDRTCVFYLSCTDYYLRFISVASVAPCMAITIENRFIRSPAAIHQRARVRVSERAKCPAVPHAHTNRPDQTKRRTNHLSLVWGTRVSPRTRTI